MRILFVCTGNTCRSPLAERLTRGLVDASLGASAAALDVGSAGTSAVAGAGMDPTAAHVLRGLGGRPEGFEARQLTARMVQESDLVLTMTRSQREAALSLAPRALRRTFTLREATDLVGRVDLDVLPPPAVLAERGRALAASLDAARPARPVIDRRGDDIADPVGRRTAVHAQVGREVHQALLPLVQALCGSGATDHRPSSVELTERVGS